MYESRRNPPAGPMTGVTLGGGRDMISRLSGRRLSVVARRTSSCRRGIMSERRRRPGDGLVTGTAFRGGHEMLRRLSGRRPSIVTT